MQATAFNQDISSWETGAVVYMQTMFFRATNFDQNISLWDVRNVEYMGSMFRNATNFNQDLSSWNSQSVQDCIGFATGATAWLDQYGGSIAGKTPPLSASLIAAGCD